VTKGKAVYWDGRNDKGESLSSGTYFYQISAGIYEATRKMIVLK
jgi:flagellar hook assembly protein FlgD